MASSVGLPLSTPQPSSSNVTAHTLLSASALSCTHVTSSPLPPAGNRAAHTGCPASAIVLRRLPRYAASESRRPRAISVLGPPSLRAYTRTSALADGNPPSPSV